TVWQLTVHERASPVVDAPRSFVEPKQLALENTQPAGPALILSHAPRAGTITCGALGNAAGQNVHCVEEVLAVGCDVQNAILHHDHLSDGRAVRRRAIDVEVIQGVNEFAI